MTRRTAKRRHWAPTLTPSPKPDPKRTGFGDNRRLPEKGEFIRAGHKIVSRKGMTSTAAVLV